MAKLISNRCSIQSTVPESYVLPPERRPGKVLPCKTIPVIDLNRDQNELIPQIIQASQEYGFFQLTNHGVGEELMKDVLVMGKEFFELPVEEKERFYSDDPKQSCRVKTSLNYGQEKVHFWIDNLRHPCHPLKDHIQHWPQNPARYREVFGHYSIEVRKVGLRILDLICDGLGLEPGYFGGELSQDQVIGVNHYPACPDPTLVLGLPKHGDPYLITLLNQGDVAGLQVLKGEQWLSVEPVPNAFVININHMLQVQHPIHRARILCIATGKATRLSQEYGFFQLTNHGVGEELMKDVLVVGSGFFELPAEEKEVFYSENPKQSFWVKTSINFGQEKVHFWRDNVRQFCRPLEDHIQHRPQNPARYRKVFGRYSIEVRNLGLRILDLISDGLGLELGYFGGGMSHGQLISLNHYPACPDPTLVLGLPKHSDPYLITVLNQGDVAGLQVLKDEEWLSVEPLPHAFVININHMLQVISNGKIEEC